MGRHRKETVKIKIGLSVDPLIKEKLSSLGVNMSQLFTHAALKEIERIENKNSPPQN